MNKSLNKKNPFKIDREIVDNINFRTILKYILKL